MKINMRALIWTIKIIGMVMLSPIILLAPGFLIWILAEELEEKQDRKEGKWR